MYVYIHNPRHPLPCCRGRANRSTHSTKEKYWPRRACGRYPSDESEGAHSVWHTLWERRRGNYGSKEKATIWNAEEKKYRNRAWHSFYKRQRQHVPSCHLDIIPHVWPKESVNTDLGVHKSVNTDMCTRDMHALDFTQNPMTGFSFSFKKASLPSAGWTQRTQRVAIVNFTGTHTNIRRRRVGVDVRLSATLYIATVQRTAHHSFWTGIMCGWFSKILIRCCYAKTDPRGLLKSLKSEHKKPAPGEGTFLKNDANNFSFFFFLRVLHIKRVVKEEART